MIIYTKKCLACTNRALWKKLKSFAYNNKLTIEERRIGKKKEWADEASQYGIEPPFAVRGKIALSLTEDLEKLL